MATSSKLFGPLFLSLSNAEINFAADTIKALLCDSSYVPDQDAHRYKSSVTGEITGTGYTAGGVTCTSKTVTYDSVTNLVTWDCADPAWVSATFTARYLVFYKDTGSAATSPLISYVDFGADLSVSAGPFSYTVPTTGLAQIAVS